MADKKKGVKKAIGSAAGQRFIGATRQNKGDILDCFISTVMTTAVLDRTILIHKKKGVAKAVGSAAGQRFIGAPRQ